MTVDALRECARRGRTPASHRRPEHHDIACGFESLYDFIQEWITPIAARCSTRGRRRCTERTSGGCGEVSALTVHTTIANYQMRPRYRYVPALVNYEKLTPRFRGAIDGGGAHRLHSVSLGMEAGGFSGTVAYENVLAAVVEAAWRIWIAMAEVRRVYAAYRGTRRVERVKELRPVTSGERLKRRTTPAGAMALPVSAGGCGIVRVTEPTMAATGGSGAVRPNRNQPSNVVVDPLGAADDSFS